MGVKNIVRKVFGGKDIIKCDVLPNDTIVCREKIGGEQGVVKFNPDGSQESQGNEAAIKDIRNTINPKEILEEE